MKGVPIREAGPIDRAANISRKTTRNRMAAIRVTPANEGMVIVTLPVALPAQGRNLGKPGQRRLPPRGPSPGQPIKGRVTNEGEPVNPSNLTGEAVPRRSRSKSGITTPQTLSDPVEAEAVSNTTEAGERDIFYYLE